MKDTIFDRKIKFLIRNIKMGLYRKVWDLYL